MNAPLTPSALAATAFAGLPFSAAQHVRLALFGVIARVAEACTEGDLHAAVQAHPFLADYLGEIEARMGEGDAPAPRWWQALRAWEQQAEEQGTQLPLLALQRAGLDALELELLLAVGLIEEDPRFGTVFARAQGGERRPSWGLLLAWWRDDADDEDRADAVRAGLQRLLALGLLRLSNPDAPRADWLPSVALPVWDALRGDAPVLPWLRHQALADLPQLADYIAPAPGTLDVAAAPALLAEAPAPALLLRGPAHNGRKTLAGALARALGKSVLLASGPVWEDAARWQLLGVLATVANAVPLIELELAPGESRTLPALALCDAPLLVVTGRHGAWACADGRAVLALDLPLPGPAQRLQHWQASLPEGTLGTLGNVAAPMRLASGNIRRVAQSATGLARLAGCPQIEASHLRQASRSLQSARLETLATRLEPQGTLDLLALDGTTREELQALLARCRWREQLAGQLQGVAASGVGVKALLAGPSGTGKTLAARLLAAELGKDVYRVDLAATVNKYLGETEKNLNQALGAAEELDVVLLLDEGDALMASRTDVGSSNDRYANLETNFLLQRIEFFEGILLVTSNAASRIDPAFARRMDAVLHFRVPDEWQRYSILQQHLGPGHAVDAQWLQDVAQRCALTGGQWRNVAAHARLLALQAGLVLQGADVQAALVREYRKSGGQCPLRPAQTHGADPAARASGD